jgi:hypothetical protein
VQERWEQAVVETHKAKYGMSIIAMLLLGALVNYAVRALLEWWFKGPEHAEQIKEARLELLG